jgi:hypothetical protein
MQSKRFLSTVVAIFCSSCVCGLALYKVPADAITEVLKGYYMLVGGLLGVYASSQTVTDTKKLNKEG